uniref:Uncharacterized protein n=1 Tax=Cacopsylla melanoneura TaxID=428564 RepID=A0A8D9DVU6_9HEMI
MTQSKDPFERLIVGYSVHHIIQVTGYLAKSKTHSPGVMTHRQQDLMMSHLSLTYPLYPIVPCVIYPPLREVPALQTIVQKVPFVLHHVVVINYLLSLHPVCVRTNC